MFEIGQLPVFIQLEADYSVVHPRDRIGSRWDFRLNIIHVIPTSVLVRCDVTAIQALRRDFGFIRVAIREG